jgi:phage terminase large subunit
MSNLEPEDEFKEYNLTHYEADEWDELDESAFADYGKDKTKRSEFVLNYHEYFDPLYNEDNPESKKRHFVFHGGRAGRKSWEIARALLIKATTGMKRIVCVREYQNSIADSVHALLKDQMELLGIADQFDVQKSTIYHKQTGSQFIYKGLANSNAQSMKSLEGADICWVEEAQVMSENSWSILIPTIRKRGSQIVISLNPELAEDPTSVRFLINTPPNTYIKKITYLDNVDLSQEMIDEAEWCRLTDPDAYKHIWLGDFRRHSDTQVLNDKWTVKPFEVGEDWIGPYYGCDFGFSTDPMAVLECWINGMDLYVRRESVRVGVEIEDMIDHIEKLTPSGQVSLVKRNMMTADNARPELISYLQKKGYRVKPTKKWKGSVEDGILKLRSFRQIYVHPDCKNTEFECKYYSYKVDRLTDAVLPDLVDKNNHCIDALRYALEDVIISRLLNYNKWV